MLKGKRAKSEFWCNTKEATQVVEEFETLNFGCINRDHACCSSEISFAPRKVNHRSM